MSNRAFQGYVVIGATGQRINSDRMVIGETALNDPRWIQVEPFLTKMLSKFHKMDTISLMIDGESRTFQTQFLVSAGMDVEDTDDAQSHTDEEILDSISIGDIDALNRLLND